MYKYVLIFLAAVIMFEGVVCVKPTVRLKAIPKFPNMEKFYSDVRERKNQSSKAAASKSTDTQKIKSRVCAHIIKSRAVQLEGRIKPIGVGSLLSIDYWDLRVLKGNKKMRELLLNEENEKLRGPYQFPTKERQIRLKNNDGNVGENAFFCLGLMFLAYGGYYVSEEYNMNLTTEERNVAGRFIFTRPQVATNPAELSLVAMVAAEVIPKRQTELEELYLRSRQDEIRAERMNDDPVCKLNKTVLMHICSSILNSTYFDKMILIEAYEESTHCSEAEISFKNSTWSPRSEWLVDCKTTMKSDKGVSSYYVSRGNSPDNFFVISGTLSGHFLVNLSENVVKYYISELL